MFFITGEVPRNHDSLYEAYTYTQTLNLSFITGEVPKNHDILRETYSLCYRLPVLNTDRFKEDFFNVSKTTFSNEPFSVRASFILDSYDSVTVVSDVMLFFFPHIISHIHLRFGILCHLFFGQRYIKLLKVGNKSKSWSVGLFLIVRFW